ncbi:MAG: GNAT family N-acetyltransferase [Muribaculaceae bacterium]|nr:GNAT family N-acetyltransferase [Muribaculaceae bacterium]
MSDNIELKVHLRAPEPADVDTLYVWENTRSLWTYGNTRAPLSRFMLSEYVNNYVADPYATGQLRMMVELDGNTCGCIDMYEFDPSSGRGGVGIFISPRYRGRGVATQVIKQFALYCRDTLNMHQLWCITAVDNRASLRAFEKSGYKIAGRLRSWIRIGSAYHDAFVLQLMLESMA